MTELNELKNILDEYAFAKRWLGNVNYNAIALGEESGEVLGKVKKWMRDDKGIHAFPHNISPERKTEILLELFDVLFYWTYAIDSLSVTPETVLAMGIHKISSRKERGTQHGSGDNR